MTKNIIIKTFVTERERDAPFIEPLGCAAAKKRERE